VSKKSFPYKDKLSKLFKLLYTFGAKGQWLVSPITFIINKHIIIFPKPNNFNFLDTNYELNYKVLR